MSGGLSLLMVGDELLDGRVDESNSREIVRRAATEGWRVESIEVVGDTLDGIVDALDRQARRARAIVVSGGLGPTEDDRTRAALARWLGEDLVLDDTALHTIEELYRVRGRVMSPSNRRQAMRPVSAQVLPNPIGTAPALVVERAGTLVFSLPGVPAELRAIFRAEVIPRLRRARLESVLPSRRLRTTQLAESVLADRSEAVFESHPVADRSWCVSDYGVDLILRDPDPRRLEAAANALRAALGPALYAEGDRGLPEVTVATLGRAGLRVAVAESCTGGGLGAAITSVPGSSEVFVGGILAYADRIKREALGVEAALLAGRGAVSEEVAVAMARGARARFGADLAVATTGIAGPAGGTRDKPVGTVFLALAAESGTTTRALRYGGDRDLIRRWTVAAGLDALRRAAIEDPGQ